MPESKTIAVQISRKAVDAIIAEEISSLKYYNHVHCRPSYPGGDSGVTIGIGYDLGYNTRQQVIADWRGRMPEPDLEVILACCGKKGDEAKLLCKAPRLQQIVVPYVEAYKVFVSRTLPRFAALTLAIYPGLEQLKPDAIGALVSMVYNRGNSLEGDRRTEMKQIVPLVAAKNYGAIAAQIVKSKRLWKDKGLDGLLKRRDNEAALVLNAERSYSADELITITLNP
jgi:hypothetical protein